MLEILVHFRLYSAHIIIKILDQFLYKLKIDRLIENYRFIVDINIILLFYMYVYFDII